MKRTICAVAVMGLAAGFAFADAPKTKKAEAGKGGGDTAAMMAAFEKAATPGENHKFLQAFVGTWSVTMKAFMEPGKPPVESTGTSEVKLILGGRYMKEHVVSTFMGKPFEGQGVTGYDNTKKQFVGSWVDSMGTGIMTSTGTVDATGKVFTSTGLESDAMTGKDKTTKMIDKVESDKKRTSEFWAKGPDGKEMKTMELTYTRK